MRRPPGDYNRSRGHQLAVQVEQHPLGTEFFGARHPPISTPPQRQKKTNLNVENTGVKCAFSPDVVSDVTMFVATDVEAHGIPTGAARSA